MMMFETEPFEYNNASCLYASAKEADLVFSLRDIRNTQISNMTGIVLFRRIHDNLIFIRSFGNDALFINGHSIHQYKTYIWKTADELVINGNIISNERINREIQKDYSVWPVFIPHAQFTPEVKFYSSEGQLWITGSSVPEDAREFYQPLLLWIDKYLLADPPPVVTIHIGLEFFNTLTSRLMLEFLKRAEKRSGDNVQVLIKWYYEENDEDIMEAGENYAYIVRLPFEMIPFKDKESFAKIKAGLAY
jgi:hypothetical protein